MFQLAHRSKTSLEPVRQAHEGSHAPALPVGKQSLTAPLASRDAAPDSYEGALASARREIAAVRQTALAAYAAVLARRDLTPLAQEIEATRIAMQVRYLLTCASRHVVALESSAAQREPVVRSLRGSLDVELERATALGVYRETANERPRRAVDEMPRPSSNAPKTTKAPTPAATPTDEAHTTSPASIARARTRMARGTGAPPDARPTTKTTKLPITHRAEGVRPGFRI